MKCSPGNWYEKETGSRHQSAHGVEPGPNDAKTQRGRSANRQQRSHGTVNRRIRPADTREEKDAQHAKHSHDGERAGNSARSHTVFLLYSTPEYLAGWPASNPLRPYKYQCN